MAWLAAIVCVGLVSLFVVEHAQRLPRAEGRRLRGWFAGWTVRGLGAPVGIWVLFNSGFFEGLPSVGLQPGAVAGGAGYVAALWDVISSGVFVIGTYWAAVTSAWLLHGFYRETELQDSFKTHVFAWSCFLGPLAVLIGFLFGWRCAGFAGALWLMPLLNAVRELTPEISPKPLYSRAVAHMNFDKYEQAEAAVIEELEKREDDFDGWMLLAELYAVHFHDVPEAERTLLETCGNAATTDSQRAVALQKLADWRLNLAHDPAGARGHLERIREMMPGTHLAHMAGLRMRQLPKSREELLEQLGAKKIRLPALRKDFDEAGAEGAEATAAERDQAVFRARQLSERLQGNPNSLPEREELAQLLAEKLNKVDAGLEQLNLLLTAAGRTEGQSAEWLALMASWLLRLKRDEAGGRRALERLIRHYPRSAQAFAAQRRINLMDMETRMRGMRVAATGTETAGPKIRIGDAALEERESAGSGEVRRLAVGESREG